MIKAFCDKCGEEITTNEVGRFEFIEKATSLVFVRRQKETKDGFVKKGYDLCPKCSDEVKKVLGI